MVASLVLIANPLFADDVYSFSTLQAGPMGMAGAITAKLGSIECLNVNPAAYARYKPRMWPENPQFSFQLNPSAGYAYAYDASQGTSLDKDELFPPAGHILQGISLALKPFTIGAVFAEELVLDTIGIGNESWFGIREANERHQSIAYATITITDRVRLGFASHLFVYKQKVRGVGASYGVFMSPSEIVDVGAFFVDIPNNYDTARRTPLGIEDQSINAGVSIKPDRYTFFTVDARNVFSEQQRRNLEFRIGAERRFKDHVALRIGGIPLTEKDDSYLTWGIGLLDQYRVTKNRDHYRVPAFLINYSGIVRFYDGEKAFAHMLSIVLEIR